MINCTFFESPCPYQICKNVCKILNNLMCSLLTRPVNVNNLQFFGKTCAIGKSSHSGSVPEDSGNKSKSPVSNLKGGL